MMRKYTVTSLTKELDTLLYRHYPSVTVEGEVSQVSLPASGHCYLTLRDREATLACVVWKSDWQNLSFRPKRGDRVLCRGRVGVYPSQGRYQLYVRVVRPVGAGDEARKLEEIRARLEADGLLDPRRKRPLPRFPAVVGVATSLTGAALQDFLKVSRERFPGALIRVAGCKVQGPDAAGSVIRALELLFDDGRSDVVVVTRGGGSKTDLMAFNDEQLARWIATAPVPVVSAVGHEVDTSLADLVADAVAPTPSAAALLVLPDGPALAQRVDELALSLDASMSRFLANGRSSVGSLQARLRHPGQRLAAMSERRQDLSRRLMREMERYLAAQRVRLDAAEGRIVALSPYGVLDRGYALVTGPQGLITSPDSVQPGDPLEIRLAGGELAAEVARPSTDGDGR